MVLGDLGNAERGQVRVAQLQHAGPQEELPAIGPDVAQMLKSEQESAGGRTRHVGFAGDLAQGHARSVMGEGPDHREPSFQGLNKLPGALVRLTHAGMLGESTHGVQVIGMRTTIWRTPLDGSAHTPKDAF